MQVRALAHPARARAAVASMFTMVPSASRRHAVPCRRMLRSGERLGRLGVGSDTGQAGRERRVPRHHDVPGSMIRASYRCHVARRPDELDILQRPVQSRHARALRWQLPVYPGDRHDRCLEHGLEPDRQPGHARRGGWATPEIALDGYGGCHGSHGRPQPRDRLRVRVWSNPGGDGPATFHLTVRLMRCPAWARSGRPERRAAGAIAPARSGSTSLPPARRTRWTRSRLSARTSRSHRPRAANRAGWCL
jgi:hypothetical protein